MKQLETLQQLRRVMLWEKRLRLARLPQPIRSYATQVVAVALAACLIILLVGLGIYPLETTIDLPETLSPIARVLSIPFSLMLMFVLGLGLLARALYYASYQPGWVSPFLTRFIIGLLALALPLTLLSYSQTITGIWNGTGLIQVPLKLQFVFMLLAILSGCTAVLSAFIRRPRMAHWAVRFGMGSYVWTALALLLFKLWWDFLARQNQINEESIALIYIPTVNLVSYVAPMVWMVGIIFFWQAITEVKLFSREIGLKVAKLSQRVPWLLVALFAVKGIVLLAGYVSTIWSGQGEPWKGSMEDGPLAWLLALLFALAMGWWLWDRRKLVDSSHLIKGALLITIGFLLPMIVAFLLWLPATVVVSLISDIAGLWVASVSSGLAGVGYGWSVLFAALLVPLGFVFQRWPRFQYLAPIALLTGLWSLPSVIEQVLPTSDVSFQYLTYDVALMVVLLALTVLQRRRKQHRLSEGGIAIVLVVSTLVALAETLIFSNQGYLGFVLLLVLPTLYQLIFDSADLNIADSTQGSRVLRTLGFQALLMLVVAWAVALRLIVPGQDQWEDVANKLFLPPFLLLYLTTTITNDESISADRSRQLPNS